VIAEIRARLGEVAALRHIGDAAGFQVASERNPPAHPAAFVLNTRQSGGPSGNVQRTRQKVAASVGIVLVVRNVADAQGGAAGADIDSLRGAVLAKLLGWSPTAAHGPLEFDNGQLLAFRDGYLWWQDSYRTYFQISA